MIFTKEWIDSLVDSGLSAEEIADKITMVGLEVDTVSNVCGEFSGVVVAEVKTCEMHPKSDHLHVTTIDCGDGQLHQVVCGAPNCRAGLKTAFAKIGAVLPGIKIESAVLRGVASNGMCCSYKELGMAEESDGIIELPDDAPVGMDLHQYMKLDDKAIDIDLTTNRPDCLGMRGIAREISVITRKPLNDIKMPEVKCEIDDTFPLEVKAPDACPRYLCRMVRGVNQKARSPLWMTERLRRCGIRSVSPIVDVTNYVMLELSQPLHSFDLNKLNGKIIVRLADEGEKLTVLSGEELTLHHDTLVIADEKGAIGLAGIFGGENSGISDETVDVLFESAFFAPVAIKGRARSYGLDTDASHRFERGVDPEGQRLAIERATELLLEIGGGKAGPIVEAVSPEHLPVHNDIVLRSDRLEKVLGCKIEDDEVFDILKHLDLNPERIEGGFKVHSPSFRFDIEIEEDLIEEVARMHGYDKIENRQSVSTLNMPLHFERNITDRKVRGLLCDLGYTEAVTYSFTDPKYLKALGGIEPIVLCSPISPELSCMRTTLTAGLINAAKYNINRQQKRVRFFEKGLKYIKDASAENGVRQDEMLCGLITGSCEDENWCSPARAVDFFDIKGDVEELLSLCADKGKFTFVPSTETFLHPGQSADVLKDGVKIGYVGMLHPKTLKEVGLKQNAAVFELLWAGISERSIPLYHEISKFPSHRRDFAFVLSKKVSAADLIKTISEAAGALLHDIKIFDVFESESLGDNKSVAVGVVLQDNTKTLDDKETEGAARAIVEAVEQKLGGHLRA
ncbi:MAG: phenylalanine--tRNA ligase subunit beta [Proteobacteria bacterium]|uniref:Phenylalanine--tRNA ligase beta subunit n=1 Tax=Candidatus Avisuccinivibrio stercorigallinarum TaxID=2840704 RepID=A0A9D9GU23_9GAMM|nr:phenylalanine--tRNA ligase subunit beta [Candidatus Avisuccinivibrio stercorigallinarum]